MSSAITGFIVLFVALNGVAIALVAIPLLRRNDGRANAPYAAIIAAVALPALAVPLYVSVSNYDWSNPPAAGARAPATAGDMADVIKQLEARLVDAPDDFDGWLLLGRSYMQMQRFQDARGAFAAAAEIEPSNNTAKLELAEVDILLDRANLGGDAGQLVEQVLSAEPDNPKALFYGGMAALARGDTDAVRTRWQKLLAMSPPDNIRELLEQQLAQLDPGAAAVSAAEPALATNDNGIDISVTITDELSAQLAAGATLFVLARQPGVAGPPIAAIRTSAQQLPAALRISDSDTMIAGRTLGGLDAVELVARVSMGGGPIATSGDFYGETIWTASDNGERAVTIVIDQIVE